jgi:hypothetical protein
MKPRTRTGAYSLDDSAVSWLLLVVGALPVAYTLLAHEPWSFDASCGLLIVLFALRQLCAARRSRRGAPP